MESHEFDKIASFDSSNLSLKASAQTAICRSFWKASSEKLQREGFVIWFLLKDNQSPWYAKMIAGCVLAYILSPVQLIPSFIPVIGLSDESAGVISGSGSDSQVNTAADRSTGP